jgi:hypothetical protein
MSDAAARITSRLSLLFPELAQQLQGEEVERAIAEEVEGWTYLPLLPEARGWFFVSVYLTAGKDAAGENDEATWCAEARFRPEYPQGFQWAAHADRYIPGVYAWKPRDPAPLTPEARAYLEREAR